MHRDRDMDKLTREVRDLARHHGAVLVGEASIDRFEPQPPYYDSVPPGHHPKDFVPDARSAIILNPVVDAPAKTFPSLCDRQRERYPNAPVRSDCYRICPIPRLRTNLPQRLTAIVEEWKGNRKGAPKED